MRNPIGLMIGGFLFLCLIVGIMYRGSARTATFTVNKTTASAGAEGGIEYRVFTNQGVFECQDSLMFGQFRSSDTFGKIEEGGTYTATVAGWRNGFFSMYPNIIEIQ